MNYVFFIEITGCFKSLPYEFDRNRNTGSISRLYLGNLVKSGRYEKEIGNVISIFNHQIFTPWLNASGCVCVCVFMDLNKERRVLPQVFFFFFNSFLQPVRYLSPWLRYVLTIITRCICVFICLCVMMLMDETSGARCGHWRTNTPCHITDKHINVLYWHFDAKYR